MKIEIWSDFVCPFCYIGKRRLEEALSKFPHWDKVAIEFKSFELDRNAPKESDQLIHEALAAKYGMSVEEAKKMSESISEQARGVGLTFNFEKMMPTNTFDAHRLTHFAKTKGAAGDLTEKLLYAYFTEAKNVSNREVLADLAEAVGIDREEALAILDDEKAYADDVRYDQATAQQIGVRGVPFFVINQKYTISGAQPPEVFLGALEKVWEEERVVSSLQGLTENADDAACTDGHCIVPNETK